MLVSVPLPACGKGPTVGLSVGNLARMYYGEVCHWFREVVMSTHIHQGALQSPLDTNLPMLQPKRVNLGRATAAAHATPPLGTWDC